MKKCLLIFFLLSEACTLAKGQVSNIYVSGQSLNDNFRLFPEKSETKIYGSPYADENWTYGRIDFYNLSEPVIDHLRLNASTDELEIFNKGKRIAIKKPFQVKEAHLGNRKYIYSLYVYNYGKSEYISGSYFHVVTEGKIDLLKRYYCTIVNNSYAVNYMGGGGDGRNYYNLKDQLFYRTGSDETIRILPRHRKDLLKLLGSDNEKLKSYIKENHINLNTEEGIIILVAYYNSL